MHSQNWSKNRAAFFFFDLCGVSCCSLSRGLVVVDGAFSRCSWVLAETSPCPSNRNSETSITDGNRPESITKSCVWNVYFHVYFTFCHPTGPGRVHPDTFYRLQNAATADDPKNCRGDCSWFRRPHCNSFSFISTNSLKTQHNISSQSIFNIVFLYSTVFVITLY